MLDSQKFLEMEMYEYRFILIVRSAICRRKIVAHCRVFGIIFKLGSNEFR